MKEQYQKFYQLIEKAGDTKSFKLEEVLMEALNFFEDLRKAYPLASPDEKHELMQMMNRLHAHLKTMSKLVGEKAGMSEEDVQAYTENPSNFSPDQWRFIQESRGKLHDSVRKLSSVIHEKPAKVPVKRATARRTKSPKSRDWA